MPPRRRRQHSRTRCWRASSCRARSAREEPTARRASTAASEPIRRSAPPSHEMDACDLETIYDYSGTQTISIGTLSQDDSIEATLRVQDLLQKHFAVLGTTGCGKSSAVVLLLDRILKATEVHARSSHRSAQRIRGRVPERAGGDQPADAQPAVLAVQFRGDRRRHLPSAARRQRGGRSSRRPHSDRQDALRAGLRTATPSLVRRDIGGRRLYGRFAGALSHPRRACDDRRAARQARRQGRSPGAQAAQDRASSRSSTTRATSSCSRAAPSRTRWPNS